MYFMVLEDKVESNTDRLAKSKADSTIDLFFGYWACINFKKINFLTIHG